MRRLGALLALCAVAACGGESAPAAQRTTIDERAGTYRGVGLLDTRREVERRFGRARVTESGPFEPLDMDFYDAMLPPSPGYGKGAAAIWRFKSLVIDSYGGKAFTVAITAPDALTRQRVGVGSTQEQVRAKYAGLKCGIANEGTEWPEIPYCTGRVAPGRHIWFGGEPVRSVVLSRKTLIRP